MSFDDIQLAQLELHRAELLLHRIQLVLQILSHRLHAVIVRFVGHSRESALELVTHFHQRVELSLQMIDVLELTIGREREEANVSGRRRRRRRRRRVVATSSPAAAANHYVRLKRRMRLGRDRMEHLLVLLLLMRLR